MRLLSVIIITRNESKKIAQHIESVLQATAHLDDVEIVLVDSASTDGTPGIARQYPLKVIEIPSDAFFSPAAGRCIGMQHSNSQYIYFLDGDMQLDANWFNTALPMIEANPMLAAIAGKCHEISFNEQGHQVSKEQDRFEVGEQTQDVRHLGQSVLYRRAVLEQVGGFNPYLSNEEELELGLRISAAGYQLQRIPVPMTVHKTLYYSQENPSGLTLRQIKRDWNLERYVALGQVLRLLIGNPFISVYLRRYQRELIFTTLYLIGLASILVSFIEHSWLYFAAWFIAMFSLFMLRSALKRNLKDTVLYFLDYFFSSYGFIRGFFTPLPAANTYCPPVKISNEQTCCRDHHPQ